MTTKMYCCGVRSPVLFFIFSSFFFWFGCLFQSVLCQGLVPRVLRVMFKNIGQFREYSLQYEKDTEVERCFVLFWEDNYLKKVCVGCESLLQRVPKPELLPLARVVCSLPSGKLPLAVVGGSPSLVRVLSDTRTDSRVFVSYQPFTSEMLIRCIRQAYQDVFSMMEVTSLVDCTVLRLKTAIYEAWMEERTILCKSVRQGHVEFTDLREVLSDLIELWPSIRPFVRCTGNPEAKDKAERVSENCSFRPL